MTFQARDRRALLVAVSGFTRSDDEALADLDFAASAVQELAAVLDEEFGFSVTTVTEPGITAVGLGQLVRETLEAAGPDTALLVHLLTHGEGRDGSLYALGADAVPHESTEIGGWLTGLQHVEGRPVVLFTLDLCNSGTVTQLPWQPRYDRTGRRGWVIAACEPDRDAFNGHFTKALTEVLRDMAAQRLDLAPRTAYIPLGTLVDTVRRAVVRMADANRIYRQYVTASRVEVTDQPVVLPLFPNPAYLAEKRTAEATADAFHRPLDSVLRLSSFLDQADHGPDLRHFVDSAIGLDEVHDPREGIGSGFSGRAHELRRLSRWLGGEGASPISVVTGSPGAGKSALLGLLVCAAHPRLREPTRAVWDNVAAAPMPLERLAVAHARYRGLDAIATSLGRQLGLGDPTPEQFLTALHAQPHTQPPTLVVDALDEADNVAATSDWLTRLATATRSGTAAVRILVATRNYEESAKLSSLATAAGHCFDLDDVPPSVLLADLHAYVSGLLRSVPEFRSRHQMTGAFAGALAETLVARRGSGWGEFLVAGLYTHHFLASFDPGSGNDAAERFGASAPRTLPEVLDLDLARPSADPWLRPVLTALAHARGDGMPSSVIQRVVAALNPGPPPSLTDIQTALTEGHTYLRRSVDEDAVAVHRLFHGGLTHYLHRRQDVEPVFHALLDGLGPPGRRQWSAAEPYVLRHTLGHAGRSGAAADVVLTDPGYLLHAAPITYLPSLTGSVRRVVTRWHDARRTADRRTALALAAVEEGQPDLARRVADLSGEQPLPWAPLWAAGSEADDTFSTGLAVAVLTSRGDLRSWNWHQPRANELAPAAPRALGLSRVNGRSVLIVGTSQGQVTITDRSGRATTWPRQSAAVTALASVDYAGGSLVISGTSAGEVTTRDVASGERVGPPVTVPDGPPTAITAVGHGSSVAVGCVSRSGKLWSWYCGEPSAPTPHVWTTSSAVCSTAIGHSAKRLVLLAGRADGATAIWDVQTHTQQRLLEGSGGAANAVAIGQLRDQCVAVVGSQDGSLTVWDLATFQRVGDPIQVDREPVRAVALHRTRDGDLRCLVGGDGPTALWSLNRRARLRDFGHDGAGHVALIGPDSSGIGAAPSAAPWVTAVGALTTVGRTGRGAVAVYGDEEGTCHAVDLVTGSPVQEPLLGDGDPVVGVEEIMLGGTPVALVRSARGCRIWDVDTAAHARPPWQEAEQVTKDPRQSTAFVGGELITADADADGHVRIGEHMVGSHRGAVTVLVTTHLAGRPVALSGGVDGAVQIWDLEARRPTARMDFGLPVFAITPIGDGLLLVGAGGRVYALEHLSRRSP
ncbi:hypothetical protein ACFYXH_22065 [Streptomyces sp. NPDC002730]|uniref:hypothetical protein n=1 Tax=Streptomyces sp. NPDC002730 TaxID=3364662 RepID=UPI00369905B7